MPKRKQTNCRSDQYTIDVIDKHGKTFSGAGQWRNVENLQWQIRMLCAGLGLPLEITITKDGQMLDYNGNPTDKPIRYE